MERKPTNHPRFYWHLCKAHDNERQQITTEICPDCGQRGEFYGFSQGIVPRIARRTRLLGIPAAGEHLTYLPDMFRICDTCHGEGIALGDDFDFDCLDCGGTGGILILSQQEMDKIRRWALARRERRMIKIKNSTSPSAILPPNPIFTSDAQAMAEGFMAMFKYSEKYGKRNYRIGEMVLPCDDQGWDIFMDLIENWEIAGGDLATGDEAIELKDTDAPDSIALIALFPPSAKQLQGIRVNHTQISQKYGVDAGLVFWRKMKRFHPSTEGWIAVDEQFNLSDSRILLAAMQKLMTN